MDNIGETHPNWTRDNEDQVAAFILATHRKDFYAMTESQQAFAYIEWVEAMCD